MLSQSQILWGHEIDISKVTGSLSTNLSYMPITWFLTLTASMWAMQADHWSTTLGSHCRFSVMKDVSPEISWESISGTYLAPRRDQRAGYGICQVHKWEVLTRQSVRLRERSKFSNDSVMKTLPLARNSPASGHWKMLNHISSQAKQFMEVFKPQHHENKRW